MSPLLTIAFLLTLIGLTSGTCNKIRELLNDDSIRIGGPNNDICILQQPSCCDKAVENKLLLKTRDILKNRVFLVLNTFYQTIDKDKNAKNTLLTRVITNSDLPQADRMKINDKLSSYITGVNMLTTDDLDQIQTASALGSLSNALGAKVTDTCENLLYFELETLKNAELKYLGSVLVMLRGYNVLTQLITRAQSSFDLSDECYIGAVRGGLKFGGCNLCHDATEFSNPCVKLCRNILAGCLKGHIEIRDYLQYLAQYQLQMNELVKQFSVERETEIENLKSEVQKKLQIDREFYVSCSGLNKGDPAARSTPYNSALEYDETSARRTLDSSWLCTYVFSGVSEVNCWNRSAVGDYRLNVYAYTREGQQQNPEVPGNGPSISIGDIVDQFKDYKYKVEELSQGRDVLKPSAAITPSLSFLLTIYIVIYLTLT